MPDHLKMIRHLFYFDKIKCTPKSQYQDFQLLFALSPKG